MASLFNTKISNTYVGLLKMSDNLILSSSLREISDGSGNGAGVYLNTSGDLKASGILEFGSLKDTGENITITKFVDEADGIASNDNDTSIPTSAAIVDYVAARITLEDLDFSGDSGTGSVDLDSQVFAIVGTANEIETSAGSQQLQIGLPSNVTITSNLQVNGLLKGNNNIVIKDTSDRTMAAFYGGNKSELYFNDSKKFETTSDGATITGGLTATGSSTFTSASFSGTITGNVTGNVTGDITGVGTLSDGSTAVTQSINDNSTKIATTAYVDSSVDSVDTLSEILAIGNTTGANKIEVDNTSSGVDFIDNAKARFGTGDDLEIYHDGNSIIRNQTADLFIDNYADDGDIKFRSDDGTGSVTEYFRLDGGITKNVFSKNTIHEDNVIGEYGSDGDLQIYHSGSIGFVRNNTGTFEIRNQTTGANDLIIKNTSNNGLQSYITLEGTNETTVFGIRTKHNDNIKALFGSSGDLEIYHDGTNSYIHDGGTGNLFIQASNSLNLRSADNEWYLDGIANGAVNIYFDNVKKFETTATGIAITGGIDMNDGDITEVNSISWNDGITLSELGADNYLRLKYNDTGNGGIQIVDGDNTIQGYVYSDGGETASIGFLTGSGDWGVKAVEDGSVSIMHDNTAKLSTNTTGVSISGDADVSGQVYVGTVDSFFKDNNLRFNSAGAAFIDQSVVSQSIKFRLSQSSTLDTVQFEITPSYAVLAGSLTIGGDLTVNGTTTTVNTQTLAVEDPLISLAKDNSANSVDIGYYGRYNDGSDKYLGFFADASDSNRFKLFKGTGTEPTTTVDTAASGYEYADVLLASLEARGNLTIKQQDDSGFDGGLIITRSANTQKLVVGMDGGAVNFNSPDSLTYKFRANGTEIASIDNTGSLSVSGNINIGDNKKLNFGAVPDYEIYHNSTTNVNHVSSLIDRQLSINANTILLTNQANDSTYLNLASSLATFSQDVTIGSTGAASDKTLSILTGGSNSSIKLMEAGNLYGFSQVYDGANNQFFIKRHSNSATGSAVVTMNRDNDAITLAGNLSSTASTVHFSLANMSAYQLNGTYVMDSSRNLVNIGNFTGAGSIKSTLAIDNSTLPDVPSEHVILLNPPTTTDYYGGGISWSEGTNTAASLGVYDAGSGGALGMYFATGSNSGLTQALKIDNNGNVNILNGSLSITGDGSNAATLTESSAGIFTIATVDDFVVDCASDITLDAGGNDIRFFKAGTEYGKFKSDSNNFAIFSSIQDEDILFKGNDGGSTITALTLDMSDAGSATFNNNITAGGILTTNGAMTVNDGGSVSAYFNGTGSSYTQGAIALQSSDADTPEARGQGVFMYNQGKDTTWYMGTRYNNADMWQVGRKANASFDTEGATLGKAYFGINDQGSVGIGEFTPSPTPTADYRSLEIGRQGNTITGSPFKSALYLSNNASITAGSTQFTYRNTGEAANRFDLEDGEFIFSNAASGTAGNNVSWNERVKIDINGNINMIGSGHFGADDNLYIGGASVGTDHTYIGDSGRNVTIYNGATFSVASGASTFGGQVTVSDDLFVDGDIKGKSYTQTSAGSVTSIIDTNIPVEAGVWELFYMGNANDGGSSAYRSITTGLIIISVDYTAPNVVNEIKFEQTSITGGGSSDINLPVAVKILQGGSEYDELNVSTSGQTIRLKITGWAGTVGASGQARITRRL
jgi:hypothetical protein